MRAPEESQKDFSFVSYFSEMSSYLYDTYLLVLLAVQEIQQGSLLVKESNLVTELHMMCLDMYNDNQLTNLSSCLTDVISTAIGKFISLGLLAAKIYPS